MILFPTPENRAMLAALRDLPRHKGIDAAADAAVAMITADPQWQAYVVFPGEFVAPERVVSQVLPHDTRRPLFILLDGTWAEARKMLHKSPYLKQLPVLSLNSEQMSRYTLRRSKNEAHFCTAEVGAMCLELAHDTRAANTLNAYLDVYTEHYLKAKHQQAVDLDDAVHKGLRALR